MDIEILRRINEQSIEILKRIDKETKKRNGQFQMGIITDYVTNPQIKQDAVDLTEFIDGIRKYNGGWGYMSVFYDYTEGMAWYKDDNNIVRTNKLPLAVSLSVVPYFGGTGGVL